LQLATLTAQSTPEASRPGTTNSGRIVYARASFTSDPARQQREPNDDPDDDCVQEGERRRQEIQDEADSKENRQPEEHRPERIVPHSTFTFRQSMPDTEPTNDEQSNPAVAFPPDITAVGYFEPETSDSDGRQGSPKNGEQRPPHAASIGARPNNLKMPTVRWALDLFGAIHRWAEGDRTRALAWPNGKAQRLT
jgi:hypothetical protein